MKSIPFAAIVAAAVVGLSATAMAQNNNPPADAGKSADAPGQKMQQDDTTAPGASEYTPGSPGNAPGQQMQEDDTTAPGASEYAPGTPDPKKKR